ncbi:hypothetical protein [Salinivibrio proteolyticus]|uniref:hypothetical protein n=1 Tax=Salinivibrio proteolyticus TaxID=334715 RepID=UPI000989861C|nr:hypothetical protein [Salinivibrio proteolyticus]OOF32025.1 hypothetical protein BZJ20_02475 [Salinivibrio proteolyticus]
MGMVKQMSLSLLVLMVITANGYLVLWSMAGGLDSASFVALWLAGGAIMAWLTARYLSSNKTSVCSVTTHMYPAPPKRAASRLPDSLFSQPTDVWRMAASLLLAVTSALFACRYLDLGTLALMVMAGVQGVHGLMVTAERKGLHWGGMMLLFAGVGYLFAPGMYAPSSLGLGLALVAGLAWRDYWQTLSEQTDQYPKQLCVSFRLSVLLAIALLIFALPGLTVTISGAVVAMIAGALTVLGIIYPWQWLSTQVSLLWKHTLSVLAVIALVGVVWLDDGQMMNMRLASAACVAFIGVILMGATPREQVRG